MSQKNQFTIKEFARLTGIKRENLRFYDRIGLLSPETRGTNNYRYYSRHQLNMAYLIGSLRGLGVGIEAIKAYTAEQTPKKVLELFSEQDARIREQIRQLSETRLIMKMHSDMVREALDCGENALFLQHKEKEAIFLCPPIPANMDFDEAGIFSYEYAEEKGINLGFPQGTLVPRQRLETGHSEIGDQYYFKVGSKENGCKPAGLYAIICACCHDGEIEQLYKKLVGFIEKEGLFICGDAYEEYPLGEIAEPEEGKYYTRIEVQVAENPPQQNGLEQNLPENGGIG